MRHRIAIVAGIAALIAGWAVSAPRAMVGDQFEARSRLVAGRAVATNYSMRIADFQTMADAATKKYGPTSKTSLTNGQVETMLDGKVVETSTIKARVSEVFGMLMVGPRRDEMARFPFFLRVSGKGEPERDIGERVRSRFGKQAPGLFEFNDFDWVNLSCWAQPEPDAGRMFADAKPRLGRAELCLVRWRVGQPRTMLIGALAADGGDFVRDASRPICRTLVAQWLEMPEVSGREGFTDFAACVLVHDPDRGALGASKTVVEHMYEVRPDHGLLAID